ncbi:MAG: hypothetical protein ABI690_36640 [Chloroflexota bacterium]
MESVLLVIAIAVVIAGIVGLSYWLRRERSSQYREIWLSHNIKSYSITLRHGLGLIDRFDSEELGSGTTLTVIDGQLVEVDNPDTTQANLDDFASYTIEGLFIKAIGYKYVEYDSIYGFPCRMGTDDTWTIEIVDFHLL